MILIASVYSICSDTTAKRNAKIVKDSYSALLRYHVNLYIIVVAYNEVNARYA